MKEKRKERLTAFNKEAIIKEANRLFLHKGMAKTTMDDIASASGYSKSTIYVYFKSKDDIFQHIILKCVIMIRDRLLEIRDIPEFYPEVCALLIDIRDKNPVFFDSITGKTILASGANVDPDVLRQTDETREEIYSIILQRLEKSGVKGIIRDDIDHLQLVYIVWSCIYGIIDMANAKSEYIRKRFKKDRNVFIREGLAQLLRLVIDPAKV